MKILYYIQALILLLRLCCFPLTAADQDPAKSPVETEKQTADADSKFTLERSPQDLLKLLLEKRKAIVAEEGIPGAEKLTTQEAEAMNALESKLKKNQKVDLDEGLLQSAKQGYVQLAEFFLAAGANLNAASKTTGDTPLHVAVIGKQKDLIHLLILRGADLEKKNKTGKTAQQLAFKSGDRLVALTLLAAQAVRDDLKLHDKTPKNNEQKLLIELREQIAKGTKDNLDKYLQEASSKGYAEVVELLIQNGANANTPDNYGMSPLHLAVTAKQLDIVDLLIILGKAKINVKNREGNTPLHLASNLQQRDMIVKLLALGADATVKNNAGQTPTQMTTDEKVREFIDHYLQEKSRRSPIKTKPSNVE